jgi:hypothetical protein
LQIAFFELSIEVLLTCIAGALQLGGDGEEFAAGVKSLILHPLGRSSGANTTRPHTFAHAHLSRHHLIRSSAEGGGGNLISWRWADLAHSIQHLLSLSGW